MDILVTDIDNVKYNPNNPRHISEDKFEKLVKSITDFPDMLMKRPLVAFTDAHGKYVVLGGNMRLKALKSLGYGKVPVILADNWSQEQQQQFIIKDNVGFGEWDWDALANEFDATELTEMGLDIPNFMESAPDLDEFFAEEQQTKLSKFSIVLDFNETDYNEAIDLFSRLSGSREQIVLELLQQKTK